MAWSPAVLEVVVAGLPPLERQTAPEALVMEQIQLYIPDDPILCVLIGWCLGCSVILLCFGLARLIQWPLNGFIEWLYEWQDRRWGRRRTR